MSLPAATEVPDCTPNNPGQTAESYLNSQRVSNHGGGGNYGDGTADFRFPSDLANDQCALEGRWTIGGQGVTAVKRSSIRLNFLAQHVYLRGSYSPRNGGPRGARTHDPRIKSPLLYQLS